MLVDVVHFISRRKNFRLVDKVHAELLQGLRLRKVADAALGHDRDGGRGHNLADNGDGGHTGNAALGADLGRHTLQRHDGDSARFLGDLGLMGIGDIHNDAAFEHLSQADFQAQACRSAAVVSVAPVGPVAVDAVTVCHSEPLLTDASS